MLLGFFSGWSGTRALQFCWLARPMETRGCGRYRAESARPFKGQNARPLVEKFSLTVSFFKCFLRVFKLLSFLLQCCQTIIYFLFHTGKKAVVGYEDGSLRLWDLKQGNTIHVIKGELLFHVCHVCL